MDINVHSTAQVTGGGGGAAHPTLPLNPIQCAIAAIAPVNASWGNTEGSQFSTIFAPKAIEPLEEESAPVFLELKKLCTQFGVLVNLVEFKKGFLRDIFDAGHNGLLIVPKSTPSRQSLDFYYPHLSKFSKNSIDLLMEEFPGKYIREFENPAAILSKEFIKPFLSRNFSEIEIKDQKKSPVRGGNMCKLVNADGEKVLAVGEYSLQFAFLRHAENKTLKVITEKQYLDFKDKVFIPYLRKLYNLEKEDHILILPQDSYHLDLSMCSPKEGVVFLNTYRPYLEKTDRNKLIKLAKNITEVAPNEATKTLLPPAQIQKNLDIKQSVLDQTEKDLTNAGIRVVRVPGALAIDAMKGDHIRPESYKLFNLFNGISIVDSKGLSHFICYSIYEEFNQSRELFVKALKDEGITSHFIGDPVANHVFLQEHGAGLHCHTTIVSLPTDLKLKDLGNRALKEGDFCVAKALYLAAHEINPRGYECLSNAALMAMNEKSYQEALDLLNQVPTTNIDEQLSDKNLRRKEMCKKKLLAIS